MQDLRSGRRRPSPAMLVALLALTVALGGTSYAAIVVTGSNVKNSSLTGADLKDRSITGRDIASRTLTASKFKTGQLPAGAKGATGATGATGPTGPKGDTGAPGATNVVMREGATFTVSATSFATGTASCNPGERATGGGLYNETNVNSIYLVSSYPTPNPTTPPATGNGQVPTGWRVWVHNELASPQGSLHAYVICAAP